MREIYRPVGTQGYCSSTKRCSTPAHEGPNSFGLKNFVDVADFGFLPDRGNSATF